MSSNHTVTTEQNGNAHNIAFSVFKSGSLSYEYLTQERVTRAFQHQPATLIYDALALSYNQVMPGDLMLLELPNRPTTSNLRKTLEARGLDENDYRLFRSTYDAGGQRASKNNRPLVLHRLTAKKMRTVQPCQTIAARVAEKAEQRGVSHTFMQDESPAIPHSEKISVDQEPINPFNDKG